MLAALERIDYVVVSGRDLDRLNAMASRAIAGSTEGSKGKGIGDKGARIYQPLACSQVPDMDLREVLAEPRCTHMASWADGSCDGRGVLHHSECVLARLSRPDVLDEFERRVAGGWVVSRCTCPPGLTNVLDARCPHHGTSARFTRTREDLGFERGCPTPFACSERGECPRPEAG